MSSLRNISLSAGLVVQGVTVDVAQMMKHKDGVVSTLDSGIQGLLRKNKIERFLGNGKLKGNGVVEVAGDTPVTITGKKILIATGSVSSSFPGMQPDGDRIGTSTEAIAWPEVPKHLVVIGARRHWVRAWHGLASFWCTGDCSGIFAAYPSGR